MGNLSKG